MYVLLCGEQPFSGENNIEIFEKIKNAPLTFIGDNWDNISSEAKTLLLKILQKIPFDRPTLEEILNDDWFKLNSKCMNINNHNLEILNRLKSYKNDLKFKKEIISLLIN